ncbi:MAG TPA: carboxypeptidase-like regulatory domain-containing protein, partial [Candidatus Acidoferrales bacterium]|nr:carboxypeptidase-like regulatory domain-containing protein [Candidatus Acidoferrales bacterium]
MAARCSHETLHSDDRALAVLTRRAIRITAIGLLALLVWATHTSAQTTGSLSGVVTDASGASVSGAALTVKNVETDAVRSSNTDQAGRYRFSELPVGEYELTVSKDGFRSVVHRGVELAIGQRAVLDFRLEIGEVRQQVTVTGDVFPVNTATADT